ncbi:hypothetical protein VKT23_016655 [Stygiomarasmius scandens]|uniref:Uncharacterized protein n=1 Tax=Marasmiellus scandens TaxID=2682957 RepID=A0ABR1IWN1_9AGAR
MPSGSTFEHFEKLMTKRPRSSTPPPSSPSIQDPVTLEDNTRRAEKRPHRNLSPYLPPPNGPYSPPSASPSTAVSAVIVEGLPSASQNDTLMTIAHATLLNVEDLPSPRVLDSSDFEEFSTMVATLAVSARS